MAKKFVDVNFGKHHLVLISESIGKPTQHYLKGKGWFTCLKSWTNCPLCQHMTEYKYKLKTKYYFDVVLIKPDGTCEETSQILLLSRNRGERLIQTLRKQNPLSLVGTPFYVYNKNIGDGTDSIHFEPSGIAVDPELYKDVLRHDWSVVCKPLPLSSIQNMVDTDFNEYET